MKKTWEGVAGDGGGGLGKLWSESKSGDKLSSGANIVGGVGKLHWKTADLELSKYRKKLLSMLLYLYNTWFSCFHAAYSAFSVGEGVRGWGGGVQKYSYAQPAPTTM